MNRIKKTIDEFLDELSNCCNELGFSIEKEKKSDLEYHFFIDSNLLRVYNSKKGINPDTSQSTDKDKVNKVLSKWQELYGKENNNISYTYPKINNIDDIISEIEQFVLNTSYTISDKKINNNLVNISKVISNDNTHEKMTLIYYNNKTLTIQGIEGAFWENVCQIIETNDEEIRSKEILMRIMNDNSYEGPTTCIDNLREELTDEVYNFLSNDDKDYLVTAHGLILEEKKFIIYTPILCSAALALEGYLKSLLLKLKLVEPIALKKNNFNFGIAFESSKLREKCSRVLERDYKENYSLIKSELEKIYIKIKNYRDTVCHSGAGLSMSTLKVKSFDKCKQIYYDQYIKTIRDTYKNIFM